MLFALSIARSPCTSRGGDHLRVSGDDAQRRAELVGDACGKLADRREAITVTQLLDGRSALLLLGVT